jgi:threonine synthase
MARFTLVCSACERVHDPSEKAQRCAVCAEPLLARLDLSEGSWPPPPGHSPARFRSFLPFEAISDEITLGEGGTPLVRAGSLGEELGLRELWFKCESANPTGSFKDRGTITGLLRARALGFSHVGTVSTGNMAMSVAAYAARLGMRCLVLAGAHVPVEKLAPVALYGANVLRYDGGYGDLYFYSLRLAKDLPLYMVNSDDPFRVEGQKLILYEIVDQLRRSPDVVVIPVSSGGNISALLKAVEELLEVRVLSKRPLVVGVQARGCNPVASAFREGKETINLVERPHTIARGLTNPCPPSGAHVLRTLRRGGGLMLDVGDDEILTAQRDLAAKEGIWVQPDSATTLAAVRRLVGEEQVSPGQNVVCVLTGHGFKDTAAVQHHALPVTMTVGQRDLPSLFEQFVRS